MKIAMIGAGAYGTALGNVLSENGHDVRYYDSKDNDSSLKETIRSANYIVVCIPSSSIPNILPKLPKQIPLIITSKGLLSEQLFHKFQKIIVISGPGYADEIKAHKHTLLTATDEEVIDLFSNNYLKFDYTDDVRGVLMCGALKNVYAIGAGLKNLSKGTNKHSEYINNVCRELKEILAVNGAQAQTVNHACGVLDLELSCDTPSRNYDFGFMLRNNPHYKPKVTTEGLSTIKIIIDGEIAIPDDAYIIKNILGVFRNESKR